MVVSRFVLEKVSMMIFMIHKFHSKLLVYLFHVGKPPVTFSMFNHVVSAIGLPPKPLQGKNSVWTIFLKKLY